LPCLSEAISDFVKGSETHEVAGFVGGESFGPDAENFGELIFESLLDQAHVLTDGQQVGVTSGVDQGHYVNDLPTSTQDVVIQFCQSSTEVDEL